MGKLLILLFVTLSQSHYENRDIPVTRWVGPGRPTTYEEWIKRREFRDFKIGTVYKSNRDSGSLVDILVDSDIYENISSALSQYIFDLENTGFSVVLDTSSGGTPEDLRFHLSQRLESGLEGALFIGDLPVPWFQIFNDFGEGIDSYEEFPIDLFYMDLDGEWKDDSHPDLLDSIFIPGSDGIYESHEGSILPEIWVGRLTSSPLPADEISLILNYFDKNHIFKRNLLPVTERALVYVDDDWVPWASDWSEDIGNAYSTRMEVFDPETTVAWDYKQRLSQPCEWISVFAHSWPGGHGFIYNDGESWSWVYASEIWTIDPLAYFYNLFACSNCRYIESGYMGGRYIFAESYGVGAIGSTKTGSMLDFDIFYYSLGEEKCLGEAFREWFIYWMFDGIEQWERSWFYGMTLLGDPTLIPKDLPPSPPSNLDTIWVGFDPGLIWVANTERDLYRYRIYRKESVQPEFSLLGEIPKSETSFVDTSTSPLTTYSYIVTAIDYGNHESSPSNEIEVSISPVFIRGDANCNNMVDISDAIYILRYKFIPGSPPPLCIDAADVDDDGLVGLPDAVYILRYKFIPGSPSPPPPYPHCGWDPTPDELDCESHPCMGSRVRFSNENW